MENSNSFWNKIGEWFTSIGLPYISPLQAMLILLAVLLVLLFLLWLVSRKARLWYWNTNIQIDTLKSIDSHLKNVEEKISQNALKIIEKPDDETELQNDEANLSTGDIAQEIPEGKGLIAVGKSGRVYTEAELELQIRD